MKNKMIINKKVLEEWKRIYFYGDYERIAACFKGANSVTGEKVRQVFVKGEIKDLKLLKHIEAFYKKRENELDGLVKKDE